MIVLNHAQDSVKCMHGIMLCLASYLPWLRHCTLSRACLPECGESIEEKCDIKIIQTLPISDIRLHQLKEESKKDPYLQQLASMITTEWPKTKQDVRAKCLPYWNYRDKLSVCNDIIFKGEKVVIPSSMQREMLHKLHSSHLGELTPRGAHT